MSTYRLFWKSTFLGSVSDVVHTENLWHHGILDPAYLGTLFEELFMTLNSQVDPNSPFPFSDDYLDDSNWRLVDEHGVEGGIVVPAVHDNREIEWMWR